MNEDASYHRINHFGAYGSGLSPFDPYDVGSENPVDAVSEQATPISYTSFLLKLYDALVSVSSNGAHPNLKTVATTARSFLENLGGTPVEDLDDISQNPHVKKIATAKQLDLATMVNSVRATFPILV